ATLARLLHDHIGDRRLSLSDDRLQIAGEVRALSSVLVNRDGKPPISVGLFGDWGTGKSFFMELMHGYIEELAEASRAARARGEPTAFCGHVVQIRFNAWHYMDSNLWASLATRVFEGLAEHVTQREDDPESAKQKLFDKLAESEGILSQVRAERNTADAELVAARTARTAAAADREAAAGARASAVQRREAAQAEQARLQKVIEGAAMERKRHEERLGRSVSVALAAAMDEARADPGVASALDAAAGELGIERERLQVDEVRQMLRQMRGIGGRMRTLATALGSPGQRRWRIGAVAWVLVSAALVASALRWLGGVVVAGAVAAAVLASAATLSAAVEKWLRRLSAGIGAVERANGLIQGRIAERTAEFRAEEEAARAKLAELADLERQALAEERAARDDERRALEAERTAREIEAAAKAEERAAAAAEQQARERVEAVKREIGELRAGRKLQTFIQDRSGTAEYRQHLGLVSTIRKDFEQLSRLLTGIRDQGPEDGLPHIDRIILYIDDLDRCPEDRVVEVLQAVHLLLAFPLFVVVMGVDSRWLLRSLEDHYAALRGGTAATGGERTSTPQNYLEKIFQIPFTLRRMDSGGFERLMDSSLTVRRAAKADPASGTTGFLSAANEYVRERTGDDDDGMATDEDERMAMNLTPAGLEVEDWELTFLHAMHPLIGSPRSARRFVNIYQFIRARLEGDELQAFRGTAQGGEYQVAAMLLAALVGHPREALRIFARLLDPADTEKSWWTLVGEVCARDDQEPREVQEERARLRTAIDAVKSAFTGSFDIQPFRDWAPLIKRFSFHFSP
ncbi:MAG TPA: P-loop NTPase fold protein, partial [Longimicrobium sp.]|nr:P-loop NTPase fold protein [Longimicrobium sp.]